MSEKAPRVAVGEPHVEQEDEAFPGGPTMLRRFATVYLDGRRVGMAPLAVLKSGRVLAGNPTCDTCADAVALKTAIKAGESGGWAPPDVNVRIDAPDLMRDPLEWGVR